MYSRKNRKVSIEKLMSIKIKLAQFQLTTGKVQ